MNLDNHAIASSKLDEGRWLLAAGRPRDAVAALREALRLDPGNIDARLAEAEARMLLDEPLAALATLHALDLGHPHVRAMPRFAELRAHALLGLSQPGLAAAALVPWLASCPGDARVHRLLAEVELQLHRVDEAIGHLRNALACEPSDPLTRRTLSRLLAASQPQAAAECLAAHADSRDAYQKSNSPRLAGGPSMGCEAEPGTSAGLYATQFELATLLMKAGRDADARELLERLVAAHPDDPAALLALAAVADRQGAIESALPCWKAAARRGGRYETDALTGMGRALLRSGRAAEAVMSCWRLARKAADPAPAWAMLVACGLMLRRPRLVGLAQRRLMAQVDPSEAKTLVSRAWLDAAAGRVIESRGVEEAPSDADSPLQQLLHRTAKVLDEQAARKPAWADSFYHAAVCFAAMGNSQEATQRVQAALDLNPHYKAATELAGRLPYLEERAA